MERWEREIASRSGPPLSLFEEKKEGENGQTGKADDDNGSERRVTFLQVGETKEKRHP